MNRRLHSDVSIATTEYGAVLLDQRSGQYWQLSRTATVLLDMLGEGRGVDEATAAITAKFDVDSATARTDVQEFFASLRHQGLLES